MAKRISAVDLFCGAGGLTHGFRLEGINVTTGIDIDPACKYPYEINNSAKFFLRDIVSLNPDEVLNYYPRRDIKLLAGCAPCQPFSTYTQGRDNSDDKKWKLLYSFGRLIESIKPEIVTMENVPKVVKHEVFDDFVEKLRNLGYHISIFNAVDCRNYGIPQSRKRLVLFASIFGKIELELPTFSDPSRFITVRETIGHLPEIKAGETHPEDPLHRSSSLSEKNLRRIRASKPGSTWRDWNAGLRAVCHKKKSGKSYSSVYGRMKWDEPSPTITSQCHGFGNGRFGHPEQDRAISLREAAILQTFPETYAFVSSEDPIYFSVVGRLIGNAVPVDLARVIARSITKHVSKHVV